MRRRWIERKILVLGNNEERRFCFLSPKWEHQRFRRVKTSEVHNSFIPIISNGIELRGLFFLKQFGEFSIKYSGFYSTDYRTLEIVSLRQFFIYEPRKVFGNGKIKQRDDAEMQKRMSSRCHREKMMDETQNNPSQRERKMRLENPW